jgi:hypothetical protein
MKKILVSLILLAVTAAPAGAVIDAEPHHTLLWSGFTSVTVVDSFVVTTTAEGVVVLQYDAISHAYEAVSHVFLDNKAFMQKRSGDVITVRAQGNLLYFIDISDLPNISLLGTADFGYPFYDYALFGQDLYICNGFGGLLRYAMVNFRSLTLADVSMIGIHYTAVEIDGNELYALDDYNGILHYHLSGIGSGNFVDYLYIPRRASTFIKLDSTIMIATYAPEVMIAKVRPDGPVITDTVGLLFTPTRLCAVDSLLVALSPDFNAVELISLNSLQRHQFQLEAPLDPALRVDAFRFDNENQFMAPTPTGGLIMYRLDRIPIDPTPTPIFLRPGPIVDLFLRENKLYTGGMGNPVDIYTLDTDGTPLSRRTLYEGLTSVLAMSQTGDYLAVYYPSLQSVLLTGIDESTTWYAGTMFMRAGEIEGIYLNQEKIDTLRSLLTWGTGFVHGYTLSDDNQGAPAFELSVVDRVLDVAILDTMLFVSTGKGPIRKYRIYDDFHASYRPGLSVHSQAHDLNTYDGKLLAFSGSSLTIFDYNDPSDPGSQTSVPLPFSIEASVIDQDRLVAVGHSGFVLIDLSVNPPAVINYCYRGGNIVAAGDGIVAVSNGNYVFIYDTRDFVTDVEDKNENLPASYALSQNYPNPFNPSTTIDYSLPERSKVRLVIYNVLGRQVTTLVDGEQSPGFHTARWNGENGNGDRVASGVYLYRLEAEGFTESKKMILLK